jgi:class 3 adenylate cyclase
VHPILYQGIMRCFLTRHCCWRKDTVGPIETLPLPDDPVLASWARALNEAGYWAYVFDASWRYAFVTDELRLDFGDTGAGTAAPIGCHFLSRESFRFRAARIGGEMALPESRRAWFSRVGRYVLATTPGGRDALRPLVDPEVADLIDELEPTLASSARTNESSVKFAGSVVATWTTLLRIDGPDGGFAGACFLMKPAAGMSRLAAAAALADLSHLERMRLVASPDRRPAAILMADIEASTPLARHLSSAQYFAFVRRLVRAADQCILNEEGVVGRHSGDGIVGFFLADTATSESAAARSCIAAARTLCEMLDHVVKRGEVPMSDLSLRFGLHWGATLYVGAILSAGRSEVTALGDEMNEAARIEACATGGRMLASKALIERLNRADAQALGLDPRRASYTLLADLPTATDKARRDAPAIAICDITDGEL